MYEGRYKYPRSLHMPQSRSRTDDDKVLITMDHFIGEEVVFTLKMDGENFTGYKDGFHARSLDGRHHPSRDWVKAFWGQRQHDMPEGWRLCGENLYAVHSIQYDNLPSYLMAFSMWNDQNMKLHYDEALDWFALLGVEPVPELWRGIYTDDKANELIEQLDPATQEGFVVTKVKSFHYDDFGTSVAKFVREKHIREDSAHWMHAAIKANGLLK